MRRHRKIALDTSIFIYQLAANPKYVALADQVFAWIERFGHEAVTSTVTMTEILVKPYRESSPEQINSIYGWYSNSPHLRWVPSDLEIASTAAELRARHNLKVADALQAATAIQSRATGLIANDSIFRRIPNFETLLFDELL